MLGVVFRRNRGIGGTVFDVSVGVRFSAEGPRAERVKGNPKLESQSNPNAECGIFT